MTTLKSRMGGIFIPLLPINRRAFDILRHEFSAFGTRTANSINPFYYGKVARLKRQRGISLNIGSGGRGLPGWVNVEMKRHRDTTLCLDVRRKIPLANNSVRRIFIEHVLEHVDFKSDVPAMLRDFHRILESNGVLRIIVPDAERFLKAYTSADAAAWHELGWNPAQLPHRIFTPMHAVNHVFHQDGEHLFAYDFETLKLALQNAGFREIRRTSYQQSTDPELAIDQENHAPYSLYVEASK